MYMLCFLSGRIFIIKRSNLTEVAYKFSIHTTNVTIKKFSQKRIYKLIWNNGRLQKDKAILKKTKMPLKENTLFKMSFRTKEHSSVLHFVTLAGYLACFVLCNFILKCFFLNNRGYTTSMFHIIASCLILVSQWVLVTVILIVQDASFVDVPSSPHGVKIVDLSQTTAKILFNKPDSHGGVPIHHYQVDVKEVASETWKIVRSHGVQSELLIQYVLIHELWYLICLYDLLLFFPSTGVGKS